jgi:hypothetical protein
MPVNVTSVMFKSNMPVYHHSTIHSNHVLTTQPPSPQIVPLTELHINKVDDYNNDGDKYGKRHNKFNKLSFIKHNIKTTKGT